MIITEKAASNGKMAWYSNAPDAELSDTLVLKDKLCQRRLLLNISDYSIRGMERAVKDEYEWLVSRYGEEFPGIEKVLDEYVSIGKRRRSTGQGFKG